MIAIPKITNSDPAIKPAIKCLSTILKTRPTAITTRNSASNSQVSFFRIDRNLAPTFQATQVRPSGAVQNLGQFFCEIQYSCPKPGTSVAFTDLTKRWGAYDSL